MPGLRKAHFAELGSKWFRQLFFATVQAMGCPIANIKKVELSLGLIQFDTATDRSVQGSMRIARLDLDARVMRVPNVMNLDPLDVSRSLNHRPATVFGKSLWPDRAMRELIADL